MITEVRSDRHSRLLSPTLATSRGSKAYIVNAWTFVVVGGRPTYQPDGVAAWTAAQAASSASSGSGTSNQCDKMPTNMAAFQSAISINRPLDDVFEVLTDPERTARWSSLTTGETMISTGPIGVGSTYRVVGKAFGRPMVRENVVTEYELNRRWTVQSRIGSPPTRASATFRSVDGGARIDFTIEAELVSLLGVVAPLIMAIGKRQWERDLRNLKAMMEAGAL